MTFKRKNTIKFFDNFSLALSPKLNYYLDGIEPLLLELLDSINPYDNCICSSENCV